MPLDDGECPAGPSLTGVPRSRVANLVVAATVGALFLVGLFTHGLTSALVLLVVVAFLGYLSTQTWSRVPVRGRGARVLIIAAIVVVAIVKLANG